LWQKKLDRTIAIFDSIGFVLADNFLGEIIASIVG
jgi:hypothetical protein